MLTVPSVAELATFTGRGITTYDNYAAEALSQATLLFALATGLQDMPDDTVLAGVSRNGILDMADRIYLSKNYREAEASPFQSESIGSYSYSRVSRKIEKGEITGVMWFDLAVRKLNAASPSGGAISSGAITGFEFDGIASDTAGRSRIKGADDVDVDGQYVSNWQPDMIDPTVRWGI